MAVLSAAVEGLLDEAVVAKLATLVGMDLGGVYGRRGRGHLLDRLRSYNQSARHLPWLVLADLDTNRCAPDLVSVELPHPAPLMRFRVAVREIESWLLGDPERLASFLSIRQALIEPHPESLPDPKAHVLELAKHSRSRERKRQMLAPPSAGLGVHTGAAYTATMIEFASGLWRPEIAAPNVDSLARTIRALEDLAGQT